MKKSLRPRLFLYAGLCLIVMSLIFFLSSQPADVSQQLSDGLLYRIMTFLGFKDETFIMSFGRLIRKIAHFLEYGVLAFALALFFSELSRKVPGESFKVSSEAFCTSAIYAFSDELHQYFVPGRSMQLSDILLDCAGAIAGLAIIHLFNKPLFTDREERKNFE